MQSLCTLRTHYRQWPRNTRYQADATPYLGRTFTGRIAPALPGALIRSPRRRGSGELEAAFAGIAQQELGALLIGVDVWFRNRSKRLAALPPSGLHVLGEKRHEPPLHC
jgi:hypothetical protein